MAYFRTLPHLTFQCKKRPGYEIMDNCNRTVSLRARQSSALNWVLKIVVSPLLATRIKYIRGVLITAEKEEVHIHCTFSHFVFDTINW